MTAHLSIELQQARQNDDLLTARLAGLPGWLTSRVDFWLARGLIAPDELSGSERELRALVLSRGWVMDALAEIVGAGYATARDVRGWSWPQRELAASSWRTWGSDVGDVIDELRRAVREQASCAEQEADDERHADG